VRVLALLERRKTFAAMQFPDEEDDLHDVAIGKLFKSPLFASVISLGGKIQLFAHQSSPAFSQPKSFLVTLVDVSVKLFAFQ
jgi:hypothetical protein